MQFRTVIKGGLLAGLMALAMSGSALAVTLHSFNGGEPASLDPHRVSGDWENRIVGDYIEGLMTEDAHAEPIPGQASSYTVSDDGLVYTFTIRDDAVWSDGTPVTAQDFDFAFKRLFDPETAADYAYLQYPIKNAEAANAGDVPLDEVGIRVIDDKTIEFTLEAPAPYFLDALTHYTAYPVPRHVVEQHGSEWIRPENIVGNGAYQIVEWIPNSHIRAVKSETYYDAENVQIDEVVYYSMDDISAALARYRAGEFDILTDFPADQYQLLQDQYPGQAHVAPFLGLYYYVVNHNKEELADPNVRQALSMSINREIIGPDILGTGELPAYGWVPPGTANYDFDEYRPDWADLEYGERVAQAISLMEEAGYSASNRLNLQLKYNTNENHRRIAVAIAAMWEPLYVDVELFNSEVAVHYDALQNNDFDGVGRAGWLMDYNDAINMLELLRSDIGYNYGRYNNAEYDELLRESALITDMDARAEVLRQAEEIAMGETAGIPIYYYVSKNVVSPAISGYEDNAKDIHRTRWLSKSE
ncbi:peptide ABC transporter substrate-binding protein [Pelagibacterium limicola]|uniref:peptide ABC transporter substrate-binding protein n=1 Tax=Pelagibacterium limicola TaxID=2791022 RepID=UPI0018AF6D6B|nr:peptide ABC transporter substrate-binding protein [Pelagibacterium limicola]